MAAGAAENHSVAGQIDHDMVAEEVRCFHLQKFRLYETRSKFYMIGRDQRKTSWKVLSIDRSDSCELNIHEDPSTYSEIECHDLLKRIDEGNRATGGLKIVTVCYGIVGFVKFLGPYYMLLITERKQVGVICGHKIYTISKSEMITLPNSRALNDAANFSDENRYKKLLCNVDLTKDFFFSYSYHIMHSLQKNLCNSQNRQVIYDSMFVWNDFLTHGIRDHLKSTLWTVALIYGFFKQAKLSAPGKDFILTLIARRSRYFAGTRYLKRGVNENGEVANDVEIEQIVCEDVSEGHPSQISSIVQNRGSIPLFWSQETSKLILKPDIVLHRKDKNYKATRLHFENLEQRYGNPIIILNLIKNNEKKPRESILRMEFANAIDCINRDCSEQNCLRFLHWDLHEHARSNATDVLEFLSVVAAYALNLTGFFYCHMKPSLKINGFSRWPIIMKVDGEEYSHMNLDYNDAESMDFMGDRPQEGCILHNKNYCVKQLMFQKGVIRTNCIDCLDRTNVAQYACGLAALGYQLHSLGLIDVPKIDLKAPLANDLMYCYERMGDTLSFQYGGSAAHNKIFSERRGQWKAAIQSLEFFRTLQRYYNNSYMDAGKQDAIDVFLGYFQTPQGKPSLWELDYTIRGGDNFSGEDLRSFFERSFSDGNIICESCESTSSSHNGHNGFIDSALPSRISERHQRFHSDSTPEISSCNSDVLYSRFGRSIIYRQFFADSVHFIWNTYRVDPSSSNFLDPSSYSNFVDFDHTSSSGNSCEEEIYDRSSLTNAPVEKIVTEGITNGPPAEKTLTVREHGSSVTGQDPLPFGVSRNLERLTSFPECFVDWVAHGEALCH